MYFSGWIKTSCIDYKDKIASVVFTKSCNMNCKYCHNKSMIAGDDNGSYHEDEIIKYLEKRIGLLDGVVVSGGEPTIAKGLIPFLNKVKEMGYLVKIDTNGSQPGVIRELIEEGLVDYFAMDIKAPRCKYKDISGLSFERVEQSIELLRSFGNYEFRTTVYPQIDEKDLNTLCREYSRDSYYLQQYKPIDESGLEPYDDQILVELKNRYPIKLRGLSGMAAR